MPGQVRVLVAEDNATNRVVIGSMLEIFGLAAQMVNDGAAAVEAWGSGAFDILLLDDRMPDMDGITALRGIRAAEAVTGRARTPILMLSANAMMSQVADYLAAGADGHVAKPIELKTLRSALAQALAPDRDTEAA